MRFEAFHLCGAAVLAFAVPAVAPATGTGMDFVRSYKGTPFEDSRYHGGAQAIPGRVQCAYYDSGGEGVTY